MQTELENEIVLYFYIRIHNMLSFTGENVLNFFFFSFIYLFFVIYNNKLIQFNYPS